MARAPGAPGRCTTARGHTVCVLVALLAACLTRAARAEPVELRVQSIDGRSWTGRLTDWTFERGLRLVTADGSVDLSRDDLLGIRPARESAPPDRVTNRAAVHLAGSGLLFGELVAYDVDKARVVTERFGDLTVKPELIATARWKVGDPQTAEQARGALEQARSRTARNEDTLVVVRGARVSTIPGILESLDANGARLRYRGEMQLVPRDRLFGFVPAAGTLAATSGPLLVKLSDGTAVSGRLSDANAESIELHTDLGLTLLLSWREIAEVRIRNERIVYLSDLEPTAARFTPLLNVQWPWRRDRSVSNGELRLNGQNFPRGLGVHARTELVYAIGRRYATFAATIGIDDHVRPRGNVEFRVLGDGRELYGSGALTGRNAPRVIEIPLADVSELTLIVDFGEELDVGDHADWAAARLIRK